MSSLILNIVLKNVIMYPFTPLLTFCPQSRKQITQSFKLSSLVGFDVQPPSFAHTSNESYSIQKYATTDITRIMPNKKNTAHPTNYEAEAEQRQDWVGPLYGDDLVN